MELKGKTAVVTGSTSGIGLGIAHAFAKAGANVVLNGLGTADEHAATVADVGRHGTKVVFDGANMLRPDEIGAMLEKAEADFDGVDILVNNAGIQHVSPIEDFPPEKWDAIIAINLTSSFHTIRHVVPAMKARNWGRIINVCSAHSIRASAHKAAYVAAKHGLAGLTKVVALECAKSGVTVNAISPGFVWTPLVEAQLPDIAKAEGVSIEEAKAIVLKRQPSGEFATVDQIGSLATFLASEPAAAITGSNYSIDGGWTTQ
ncbi:MAG: 3-hydroxybutyrate dehydrogenase [Hyphomicrobiaceae bacterium]|jgi:3-hydroxybutyrate dehydrogenase